MNFSEIMKEYLDGKKIHQASKPDIVFQLKPNTKNPCNLQSTLVCGRLRGFKITSFWGAHVQAKDWEVIDI